MLYSAGSSVSGPAESIQLQNCESYIRQPQNTYKPLYPANRILQDKDIPFNFEARLQEFFYLVAVVPSIQCGLIPTENLTVSGDGTAVHTHANARGHHSKYALASDSSKDTAPRHFSDPDASWGWDSDLDKFYYGYTLFL